MLFLEIISHWIVQARGNSLSSCLSTFKSSSWIFVLKSVWFLDSIRALSTDLGLFSLINAVVSQIAQQNSLVEIEVHCVTSDSVNDCGLDRCAACWAPQHWGLALRSTSSPGKPLITQAGASQHAISYSLWQRAFVSSLLGSCGEVISCLHFAFN